MSKLFSRLPEPLQGIIGHRGASGLAPENTLDAFKKVGELGLNWIEFDIQCCQGGEWIVFHDEKLNRTTNSSGLVSQTPLSIIQQLDAGSWFNPKFNKARVPLLKEVLEVATVLNLHPNIEIKVFSEDPEEKYSKMQDLIQLLTTSWSPDLPPPLVSSFDLEILDILRSLSSHLPLGYNIHENSHEAILIAKEHQFDSLHIPVATADSAIIKMACNHKLPLLVFTVNEPHQIKDLLKKGITAVFSDLTNYGSFGI